MPPKPVSKVLFARDGNPGERVSEKKDSPVAETRGVVLPSPSIPCPPASEFEAGLQPIDGLTPYT